MVRPLYLDTARMGRTSPTAKEIQTEYLDLATTHGCPPEIEDLLSHGGEAWTDRLRRRYPNLAEWRGVKNLKSQLRRLVGARASDPVLLAGRTRWLMQLGANRLSSRCRRVLATDLGWSPYHEVLRQTLGRDRLIELPLRSRIERDGLNAEEVTQLIQQEARKQETAGAFFSTISHDGIRLPVRAILEKHPFRGVVLDGAQEVAHAQPRLAHLSYDLYLAGTHKWLRSFQPMGFAVMGRGGDWEPRPHGLEGLAPPTADPLARFSAQLESSRLDHVTETTSVTGLLSTYGAANDALQCWKHEKAALVQKRNADRIADHIRPSRWDPILPHPSLRSGILILKTNLSSTTPTQVLRRRFARSGVTLSVLSATRLRLSMPRRQLMGDEIKCIRDALVSVSS